MTPRGYRRDDGTVHPPLLWPAYGSTVLRAPAQPLVALRHSLTELTGPLLGEGRVAEVDADLTRRYSGGAVVGEAQGQRIIVHGQVRDEDGRPVPHSLVEVWQANAAGRYLHKGDRHDAPIDPHFTGAGRALTDADGRYRFLTIRPGIYPWGNHPNAWRPAHIHFSLFGRAFTQRLVTQMYFPDDPMAPHDPIMHSVQNPEVRQRMTARFDLSSTVESYALGYEFDIVLRGREATPMESAP
jgi:protocatechuate 3,4-dioxygenase beta subunit